MIVKLAKKSQTSLRTIHLFGGGGISRRGERRKLVRIRQGYSVVVKMTKRSVCRIRDEFLKCRNDNSKTHTHQATGHETFNLAKPGNESPETFWNDDQDRRNGGRVNGP
jgi:hypothetical protein